jgi:hypothetical protein
MNKIRQKNAADGIEPACLVLRHVFLSEQIQGDKKILLQSGSKVSKKI